MESEGNLLSGGGGLARNGAREFESVRLHERTVNTVELSMRYTSLPSDFSLCSVLVPQTRKRHTAGKQDDIVALLFFCFSNFCSGARQVYGHGCNTVPNYVPF